jgi:hypothetical protein
MRTPAYHHLSSHARASTAGRVRKPAPLLGLLGTRRGPLYTALELSGDFSAEADAASRQGGYTRATWRVPAQQWISRDCKDPGAHLRNSLQRPKSPAGWAIRPSSTILTNRSRDDSKHARPVSAFSEHASVGTGSEERRDKLNLPCRPKTASSVMRSSAVTAQVRGVESEQAVERRRLKIPDVLSSLPSEGFLSISRVGAPCTIPRPTHSL